MRAGYRIYIAAPFQMRADAQRLMTELEAAGFTVTSRWLRIDDMPDTEEAAVLDLADVDRADALVLLNSEAWRTAGTGGRHAEFGYAIAKQKDVFVVGVRTNVFHHLSSVHMVTDPALLLPRLRTQLLLREARH
jgi:nucleoside 2-deoxyribosyltransferase